MPRLTDFVVKGMKAKLRKRKRPVDAVMVPEEGSPFTLDEALEQAASPNRHPTHKVAQGAMRRSGLLSMIRNRGNRQIVDPEAGL